MTLQHYMKKQKKIDKKIYTFVCVFSLLLFLILFFLVITKNSFLYSVDTNISNFFAIHRVRFFEYVFVFVSYLGETETIAFFCFLLICLKNRKELGIPVTAITIISLIINFVVKMLVQRLRPFGYFLEQSTLFYTMPTGYSFPSGHAQTACIFYFALTHFYCKDKTFETQRLLKTLCVIFIALMCVARVYIGVHFFSDVLAGLSLMIFIFSTLHILPKTKQMFFE